MSPADTVMGIPAIFIPFITGLITWILITVLFTKDGGDIGDAFAAAWAPAMIVAFITIYFLAKA